MKKFIVLGFILFFFQGITASLLAATYYLSPSGVDGNPGTVTQPWASFGRAWQSVRPGDTVILLDGIYYTDIEPPFGGQPGSPITIKAANDGKAVIDGEKMRVPIMLWNYRNAHFFVIEGIIVRNGPHSPLPQAVIDLETDDNILRRVSAYNADPDENSGVIIVNSTGERNLIEDCVAAGTGRKMINVYQGGSNVVRRCFAYWLGWDGRKSCQDWPQSNNIHLYNSSDNIVENCIAAGPVGESSLVIGSNAPGVQVRNNKILGSIVINAAINPDGSLVEWPQTRPQPTSCPITQVYDYMNWRGFRSGMSLYANSQADMSNNLIRDVLACGNAGRGLTITASSSFSGNRIERSTFADNGLGLVNDGGPGADAIYQELQTVTVTDSIIPAVRGYSGNSFPPQTGGGARLQHRYIDGVLMDGTNGQPAQPLWPWPMEDRIRGEIGISVTNLISKVAPIQVAPIAPVSQPHLEASVLFGTISPNATSRTVTLTNKGVNPLTVAAYVFEKGGGSPYTIGGGSCASLPFSLSSSQSCTVQIALKSGITGIAEDYLSFYSPETAAYPFLPRVFLSNAGSQITSSTPPPPPPPPTARALPGRLEAEKYAQSGGTFTVSPTGDQGGGFKVGGIRAQAWLEYFVDASQAGNYAVSPRVASAANSTKSFSLLVDGVKQATFSPQFTGGWDTFTDLPPATVVLTQGTHTLRMVLDTGDFDLNYLNFSLAGTPPSSPQNLHIQGIQ
ncbi:MAG: carbohydrate-binding protein [Acidobacteria bacterium]|nr:MAG: carbohydrate-binding protein [Acidobacteriota bacterium]